MPEQTAPTADTHYGTFGIFRWLLASLVVLSHFGPVYFVNVGALSVWAFFILSGYMACLTLEKRYLPLKAGIYRYYINRILRLYPPYWVACGVSYVMILFFGYNLSNGYWGFHLPDTWQSWLKNITTIGIYSPISAITSTYENPIFLPLVTWNISVDLIYWFIMPWLVKNTYFAIIFILSALSVHAFILTMLFSSYWQNWGDYFFWTSGAAVYFGCGYILYQIISNFKIRVPPIIFLAALCGYIFFIKQMMHPSNMFFPRTVHLLNIPLAMICIVFLARINTNLWHPRWKRFDRWAGDISLGVFLMQIPASFLPVWLFPQYAHSFKIALMVLFVANIEAYLLQVWIVRPIQVVRRRVRFNGTSTMPQLHHQDTQRQQERDGVGDGHGRAIYQ